MRWALKSTVLGLCILGVAGIASGAGAQRRLMGGAEWGPEPRLERLAARLDLTDEQVEEIEKMWADGLSERAKLRKEMVRIQNELRGEMLEDTPDIDKVRKLAVQRGEIRTKMQVARLEAQLALREILTPEQRDRMSMMRRAGSRGDMRRMGLRPHRGRIGRDRGWGDGKGRGGRPGPRHRRVW